MGVRGHHPGRQAFTLGSVECGDRQLGVVDFVHPVWINGKPLPRTEDIRIDWAVDGTDRHGTIAGDKVTSTASRATIAADALDELKSEEYDGKTVVFTVRGNFASAKIAAKLKYVAPVPTKRIAFGEGMTFDEEYLHVDLENADCVDTFIPESDTNPDTVDVDVKVNGVPRGEKLRLYHATDWQGGLSGLDLDPGDTVELIAHPNPEMPDVIQEDATISASR